MGRWIIALAVVSTLVACRPEQHNFTIPICDSTGCGCPIFGWIICGETCVDPRWDHDNCGACDVRCGGGTVCAQGACASDCGAATTCGDTCAILAVDPRSCGECGNACDGVCRGSRCIPRDNDCPASWSYCAGIGCVDLDHNGSNCGECGNSCDGNACFVDGSGAHLCCAGTLCGTECMPVGATCP